MSEINNKLAIEELFNIQHERLSLKWIAGKEGGCKTLIREVSASINVPTNTDNKQNSNENKQEIENSPLDASLIGHLNLIHPQQIQIIGGMEIKYLDGLRDISMQDAIEQIFRGQTICIIVSDNCDVPTALKNKSDEYNIPLFSTSINGNKLADTLHYFLTNFFADMLTLHGVYMEVMAIGVLITGPSGIGKSELALELISRGHRLIADDAPKFSKIAPDIINVRELFGDSAIKKNKYLRLIINLQPMDKKDHALIDRLEGSYDTRNILDMNIPEITLPVAPGRNLAVMLECAARNHILRDDGYDATKIFARRQEKLIKSKEK